jgi:hypothetical protein
MQSGASRPKRLFRESSSQHLRLPLSATTRLAARHIGISPCGPPDVRSTIPACVRGPDRILPGSTTERRAMGERTGYEPGTFCLVGLATSDPPAATNFYARLLGWDAEELSTGELGSYTVLRRGGRPPAISRRVGQSGAPGRTACRARESRLSRICPEATGGLPVGSPVSPKGEIAIQSAETKERPS